MRASFPHRPSGLTLIEVICALAIAAMLMATLMGTLTLTARAMAEAGQSARQSRVEAGIERILRHDLAGAVQPDAKRVLAFSGMATVPSEISEEPCLDFLTTAHLSPGATAGVPGGSQGNAGITEVAYVLRTDSDAPGKMVLLRGETEYAPGKPQPERLLERLATGITYWRLSFYNGAQWVGTWKRNMPPPAVKLEMSFEGEEQQRLVEMTFAPMPTTDANPPPQ
jgi:prepilin-type N-terminal cleavage/methylation domain-containing protein